MPLSKQIISLSVFEKISSFISRYMRPPSYYFRIDEWDFALDKINIICSGVRASFEVSLIHAAQDDMIISRLPPGQAALIGQKYGEFYQTSLKENYLFELHNNIGSKTKNKECRYELKAEIRGMKLKILDNKNGINFIEDPIVIISEREYIINFSSNDAFYIGFLAGIKIHCFPKNKPHLYLVKK